MSSRSKTRVNLRIDVDLHEWIKRYAERHGMTMTQVILACLRELRRSVEYEEGEVPQL